MNTRKSIHFLSLLLILLLTSHVTILGNDLSYYNFKVGDTWEYRKRHIEGVIPMSGYEWIGIRECILINIDTINTETVFKTHRIDSATIWHFWGGAITFPTTYEHEDSIETVFMNSSDTVTFAPYFSFIKDNNTSITRDIVKYKNDTLFMDVYKKSYNELEFLESYGTMRYYYNKDTILDTLLLISFNNEAFEYDSIIPIQNNVYIGNFTILPDKKSSYPPITTFNDLIHLNNKGLFEYIHIYDISGRRILNNSQIPDINRIAPGNYIIHLKMPDRKPTFYKAINIKSQIPCPLKR